MTEPTTITNNNTTLSSDGLKRTIGVCGLSANIVNIVVVAGIFILPAIVAAGLGSASLIPYLFCGFLIALIMLCFAEAGSEVTDSGGPYTYIESAFGKYAGFMTANLFLIAALAADAAIVNAAADILTAFIPSLELEKTFSAASNLGTLFYIEGRYPESAAMNETAIEINDANYVLLGNLASAYYWSPGKRSQSLSVHERALELEEVQNEINPNNPDIIINMAGSGYEARFRNDDQAKMYAQQALEDAPDNATIMYLAGSVYEQIGDRSKALSWIKSAIDAGYAKSDIINQPELQELIRDPRFQEILKTGPR